MMKDDKLLQQIDTLLREVGYQFASKESLVDVDWEKLEFLGTLLRGISDTPIMNFKQVAEDEVVTETRIPLHSNLLGEVIPFDIHEDNELVWDMIHYSLVDLLERKYGEEYDEKMLYDDDLAEKVETDTVLHETELFNDYEVFMFPANGVLEHALSSYYTSKGTSIKEKLPYYYEYGWNIYFACPVGESFTKCFFKDVGTKKEFFDFVNGRLNIPKSDSL